MIDSPLQKTSKRRRAVAESERRPPENALQAVKQYTDLRDNLIQELWSLHYDIKHESRARLETSIDSANEAEIRWLQHSQAQ